ncbi:MAG: tetratricopeptide repeat protein [Clostridia bacterium]|nr:tetratricopeptide repeat protein [Clostridia bacterium]MBN2882547.1 tetratricopeptide repeat protein [Clostridia bacterium]
MELKELIKDIKKIDLGIVKSSDVKMFQSEKEAIEYYNDAVDNVLSGNTDIAIIKLRKVLNLSPDFDEANILLDKVRQYEASKSIGDKVYENIRGNDSRNIGRKKSLPQKLHINPRILLKIIIVFFVIAITTFVCILLIKLLGKPIEKEPGVTEVTYSQQEVNELNQQIQDLRDNLALSEQETQDALSGSQDSQETLTQLQNEINKNEALLELYRAAYLFEIEQFITSADIAGTLDAEIYKGAEKELYNEVYSKATAMAADSLFSIGLDLYNQSDFEGAVANLSKVEGYNPIYEDIGRCYYLMGRSYFELGNSTKAIEMYEKADKVTTYTNKTGLLYYTGKAYQQLGNYEKAKENYNTLINEYPKSDLVGYAKDRLAEME